MLGANTRGRAENEARASGGRGTGGVRPGCLEDRVVMVIDDDEDLRRAMVELFTEIGFVVEAARDGQAALDRLRAMPEAPGLILLDLSMPVMDGASFRVEQRREASLRGIPVILVTADADAEQRAKALGVEGYLRKPVGAGELAQLVARYCSGEAP